MLFILIAIIVICLDFLTNFWAVSKENGTKKFIVDPDGWRSKIINWTRGEEVRFKGYCPFYWSSWFCAILSPFTLIIKCCENLAIYFATKDSQKQNSLKKKEVIKIADQNPVEAKFLQNLKNKTCALTSFLVKPISVMLITGILYLVIKMFWGLLTSFAEVPLIDIFYSVIIVALIVIGVAGVRALSQWISKLNTLAQKNDNQTEHRDGFTNKISNLFQALFNGISQAFSKECPLIEYKKEQK